MFHFTSMGPPREEAQRQLGWQVQRSGPDMEAWSSGGVWQQPFCLVYLPFLLLL